jgi:dephospho-CoA kinase
VANRPLLIGLTGSIGMGKTETAKMFAGLGIPIYDADAAVHVLYDAGGAAVAPIAAAFPSVVQAGRVDRAALTAAVLGKPAAHTKLEAIVHPLVAQAQHAFIAQHMTAELIVFDIPLLFETGGDTYMDVVVVVSAAPEQQHARAMARPGMTEKKLKHILARQMPDADKCLLADYVVDTSQSLAHAEEQVRKIVADLKAKRNAPA